jgi:hypothetical protein
MSKKQTLVSFRAERTDDGGWHLFSSYGQEPSLSPTRRVDAKFIAE